MRGEAVAASASAQTKERLSAARRVHMTLRSRRSRSGDDEIVTLGFARYRRADRLDKRPVGRGAAERLAQIGRILLAETHIEHAGAGDAHPVAAFAEIVGKRRDEAEASPSLLNVVIARRAAGGVSRRDQSE